VWRREGPDPGRSRQTAVTSARDTPRMTQARITMTGDTIGLEGIRLTDAQKSAAKTLATTADAGTSLTA